MPIRTYRYISRVVVKHVDLLPCAFQVDVSNTVELFSIFVLVPFFFHFYVWPRDVWFHNRVPLRRTWHILLLCTWYVLICTQRAAAAAAALRVAILLLLLQQQCCCFLLPFVIVCRMAKFVAGLLNLILVFYFSSLKHDASLMYPLAVLAAFTTSILLHLK